MAVLDALVEDTKYVSCVRGLLPSRVVTLAVPNRAVGAIMVRRSFLL